ncbi:MFS general substrate transporter [Fomitopsis serialis]|uniref:MFS general substrate transporter n=1 Tax=Fomitopsis serialis TaxID=139415 RepID=UPI00200749A5|nr:MFS general substrate transporter [Neoantrodia serialis]KAH9934659.1 MFS general substrate transporter [Neoantrodia serialis]
MRDGWLATGRAKSFGRLRLVLISCSIAANAICAGGIYTFPLISPALMARMHLTQPQLSTIMLAAMVGQYAMAVPAGKVLDRYGPRVCSLLASVIFAFGYGMFARQFALTPEGASVGSASAIPQLTVCFGVLGIAIILSYLSMLFAATRTFPQFMGFASGTSLAIFGLSPLFLSWIATEFFTPTDGVLDVTRFFTFMALLTGVVNFLGALILPGPAAADMPVAPTSEATAMAHDPDEDAEAHEETSLLTSSVQSLTGLDALCADQPEHLSAMELLKNPYFGCSLRPSHWLSAEMIKSNIGMIVLSLPTTSHTENISTQVQLIAISDTLARLLLGPFADIISPVPTYSANGVWAFPRKPYVTRIMFMAGAASLFTIAFIWPIIGVRSQEALWPLSVGTGIVNGAIFTTLPSILSSIWGAPNQGRNFGFVSYTCFFGTATFSYLYAFVADSHTAPGEGVCHGVQCWETTFWLSSAASLLATGFAAVLWRKWNSRV